MIINKSKFKIFSSYKYFAVMIRLLNTQDLSTLSYSFGGDKTNKYIRMLFHNSQTYISCFKMALQKKIDPELEQIRNDVQGPPNLDMLILQMQKASEHIHAGFFFQHEGLSVLQKLCLFISSSSIEKIYNGWHEFAAHLGLNREQIQCIDYNFKGLQDPTYYVLLTFVQSENATIDKIVTSLKTIGRLDIINRISNPLMNFLNSLTTLTVENQILKPQCLPRVPLVLSPTITIENYSFSMSTVKKQDEKIIEPIIKKNLAKSYGSIVMLTFTKDSEEIVKKISNIFRQKNPKIGVVILKEQEKYVYSKAEEFVDDCFKQVNYIVPILTKEYIKIINNPSKNEIDSLANSLDTKYVNYIYALLRYEYVKNRCCNNRVRCIVPDVEVSTVIKSDLHPTLQAWFRESDIDNFTDNILLKKF